jgi:hypothetical protein
MSRSSFLSSFLAMTVLSVILAASHPRTTRADDAKAAACDRTCVIYPLSGLGNDPTLGKWIAQTIPEVIQPGTWNLPGEDRLGPKISYHAPSRVLVVYHSAAVHVKVESFLRDLKKALPAEKESSTASVMPRGKSSNPEGVQPVAPAQYLLPSSVRSAEPAAAQKSAAYLVPPPLKQPKHLFHLIVRYEGDGVVDSSVAGLVKELAGNGGAADDKGEKGDKPNPDRTSPLNQLLHFIVRYEGEGIIDANVAALLKDLYGSGAAREEGKSCPSPFGTWGTCPPPPTGPLQSPVPVQPCPPSTPSTSATPGTPSPPPPVPTSPAPNRPPATPRSEPLHSAPGEGLSSPPQNLPPATPPRAPSGGAPQ